jgi:predicted transcriptional regulator
MHTYEEKRSLIINHLHSAPDYANNIARKIDISPHALNPVFRELRHDGTITIDHATRLLKFFKLTQKGENEWKQNQF